MHDHPTAAHERGAIVVMIFFSCLLLIACGIGIIFFSDREGFWRDQAIKRAIAEQRKSDREYGPVIPTGFNL